MPNLRIMREAGASPWRRAESSKWSSRTSRCWWMVGGDSARPSMMARACVKIQGLPMQPRATLTQSTPVVSSMSKMSRAVQISPEPPRVNGGWEVEKSGAWNFPSLYRSARSRRKGRWPGPTYFCWTVRQWTVAPA